jgi:RNA polymerase sigma-70 factor (ECF subfamily)
LLGVTSFAIDIPASLIARLKRAEQGAYEQVYRLFERPVYALAWRMLDDRDEAQEVLHDAMLCVFDKLGQFRGDAPFWGWLRQIVVNEVLMRLRKRRLDYVEDVPEAALARLSWTPHLEGTDLQRALCELPTLTRAVVWLYYVEGYTHDEIARNFGKTVSFSKSQVMRGTQKLRQQLQLGDEQVAYA